MVMAFGIMAFRSNDTVITWIVQHKIEDVAVIERLTYYNADPRQTDSSPLITAPQWKIDTASLNTCQLRWLAVSQKMIRNKVVQYGDTVMLDAGDPEIDGLWIIADCMAKRWDNYGRTGNCADLLLPMKGKKTKGLWKNVKLTKHSYRSRRYLYGGYNSESAAEDVQKGQI